MYNCGFVYKNEKRCELPPINWFEKCLPKGRLKVFKEQLVGCFPALRTNIWLFPPTLVWPVTDAALGYIGNGLNVCLHSPIYSAISDFPFCHFCRLRFQMLLTWWICNAINIALCDLYLLIYLQVFHFYWIHTKATASMNFWFITIVADSCSQTFHVNLFKSQASQWRKIEKIVRQVLI